MRSINISGYIKNILLLLCLYIFINNPILELTGGIGTIKLLYPITLLCIFLNLNWSLVYFKLFRKEMVIFTLLLLFTIFRSAFGGDEMYIRTMATSFFEVIFVSIFLSIFLFKLEKDNWLNNIFLVGFAGAIISVVSLLNPEFNQYIKGLQVLSEYSKEATFRSFGLADGLTFSYGISQGIILCLLILNSKNRLGYLIFSPLIIISCIFNARTGIVIIGLVLIYEIVANRRIKLLAFLGIIFFLTVTFSEKLIFSVDNEGAIKYTSDFFLEIDDLLTGSSNADYNTADVLFEDMIVLPSDSAEWIVGSGQSSFNSYTDNTDIGFLLQLKYGGLLFILILYSLVGLMLLKTWKFKNLRWFSILFLVSFIIANTKGDFIPGTGAFRLLFFVYIYLISYQKTNFIKLQNVK